MESFQNSMGISDVAFSDLITIFSKVYALCMMRRDLTPFSKERTCFLKSADSFL